MNWITALRERLRTLLRGDRTERELDEEMRFHIEMEAERLEREAGLDPAAARRRAAIAFGGVDRHREATRDVRGFGWLNGTSLDVKLGARMLTKYPMITVAGGLSLAVAVALAVSWFEFLGDMISPRIRFEDGDRIVVVQNRDLDRNESAPRTLLHDWETWRDDVESIRELSASLPETYTVTTPDGRYGSIRGARITSSGLGVPRTEPALGRLLEEADEAASAPLAVVLGWDAWQELFDGDREAIGGTIRVGTDEGTVVGVMPKGFGFPVNQSLWLPLRERSSLYERGLAPPLQVFGRLAPGRTLEEAQAELNVHGERTAADHPDTHRHIRPRVRYYSDVTDVPRIAVLANIPFILFLVVVCANIATLVFARTAARAGEIAVRSALGASRRRLVIQLVAESLVLTSLATALGIAAASVGLAAGMKLFWEVQQMPAPFWFEDSLTPTTIAYACGLSLLSAILIGAIPALKATGRDLRSRLEQGSRLRFGRASTAVVVTQIALSVMFLPLAWARARELRPDADAEVRFPVREFLSGTVWYQQSGSAPRPPVDSEASIDERARVFAEAKRRLEALPDIARVGLAGRLPGFNHPLEGVTLAGDTTRALNVRSVTVDADLFDVLNARIVAGRSFSPAEYAAGPESGVVIVSSQWAEQVWAGRNPIGERIVMPRRIGSGTRALEVVGVVDGMSDAIGPGTPVGVYEPMKPGAHSAVFFYAHARRTPAALVGAAHATITAIDPGVGVEALMPLDDVWAPVRKSGMFIAAALNVVGGIILGFALIGIYALMSFTVAQRSREIAVRTALGASPDRVLRAVFSRALRQIALGVVIGAAILGAAFVRTASGAFELLGVAALMMLVGLAGCVLPVARALRIQPTEALKAE